MSRLVGRERNDPKTGLASTALGSVPSASSRFAGADRPAALHEEAAVRHARDDVGRNVPPADLCRRNLEGLFANSTTQISTMSAKIRQNLLNPRQKMKHPEGSALSSCGQPACLRPLPATEARTTAQGSPSAGLACRAFPHRHLPAPVPTNPPTAYLVSMIQINFRRVQS